MKKLSADIFPILENAGYDVSLIKKAKRSQQVRKMWAHVVEDFFLDHTNSVYIFEEEGMKILVVYVDESIFAAELNGRRELIKLKFLQEFNEKIDEFKIHISRGSYKKNYPYKQKEIPSYEEPVKPIALSQEELVSIQQQISTIENEAIKKSLYKAMVTDLQWKKGISEKNSKKDES